MVKCTLSPMALGLAAGILWGVSMVLMGLVATYYAYGKPFVEAMGIMYIGYAPSIKGSLLGGLMGFVDAFIGGAVLAWLYNRFTSLCCKCCTKNDSDSDCKR